ncbi:MAG: KH domain-containing protein [Ruminococcaceae bacterium]|jgi:spoIIIJ-associated protein|nr:KH domain-containing protein [Oscillospiraceae bacterium]
MMQYIDVTGKTEEEAIEKALVQLGKDRDEISVEILERAKSGFLGIGATPATVRVSYDDGKAEPKPEKVETFQPEKRKTKEEREAEEAAAKAEKERRAAEAKKNAPKVELPKEFQPEVLKNRDGEKKTAAPREKKPREEKPQEKRELRTPVVLGEEVHDERSEQIRTFLTGLLQHMESEAEVRVYEVEKNRYKVVLEGEKLGSLIGRRGETLDAIQQLTSYAINRSGEKNRARVQIDAENYREKREQSLERLADKVAAKVVKYRRNVTLEPMNAYERHVIHTALQDTKDVSTFSIGTEPNRRVVVAFDKNKKTK